MALYPTPHARFGGRRKPHRPKAVAGWCALLALGTGLLMSTPGAEAQTTASGTMITSAPAATMAPAAGTAPPAGTIHGVADAQAKTPAAPGSGGNMLHMPAHVVVEHPTMPELPVIPPPHHIQVAVYSGPTTAAASTQITPVSVNPQATAVSPVVGSQSTSTTAQAHTANTTASAPANSPGLLPEPRIDPTIGDAPEAPAQTGTSSGSPAPAATQTVAPTIGGTDPTMPSGNPNDVIRSVAEQFLKQQTSGLPGTVTVTVSPVAPHGLASCDAMEAFLPPGAQLWGHTSVGVRCVGAKPWTLYLQARISVNATYYVAGHEIEPGQTIAAGDLSPRQGDLTNMPRSIVTDLTQIVGKASLERVGQGMLLRQDMARAVVLVQAGQSVRLVVEGAGFTISYEGSAVSNAGAGESVKVRTDSGQVISGVVKDRETVEVQM